MISSVFDVVICKIKIIIYRISFRKRIKIGKNVRFKRRCKFYVNKGASLCLGKNVFFNRDCSVIANGKIDIEDDCLFGENVKIYDHNHIFNLNGTNINRLGLNIGEVHIGKNCWIGSNVVILKGTNIGDNCVIGAGITITGNIEPNTIVKQNYSALLKEKILFH